MSDSIEIIEEVMEISIESEDDISIVESFTQGPVGATGADGAQGLQGDKGDPGIPGPNTPIDQTSNLVSPSGTITIQTVNKTDYRGLKWVISVSDFTANLFGGFELMAVHNGTVVQWNKYSSVGDSIPITIDVLIVGINVELQITNNTANIIETSVSLVWTAG